MNETLRDYMTYQYKKEFETRIEEETRLSNQIKLKEIFE
jgi:hypothetical protein